MSSSPRKYLLAALPNAVLAWCGVMICLVLIFQKQAEFCGNGADCETVLNSTYAKVGGIPLSEIGLAAYSFLLLAFLALAASPGERSGIWLLRIATLITATSAAASAWLIYLQLFVIHAFCVLCTASALIMFTLVALTFRLRHAPREPAAVTVFSTVSLLFTLATGMILWMLFPAPPKLASVDGVAITEKQIPTSAKLVSHPLEMDLYFQKQAWLDRQIDDLVLRSEARRKGLSVGSLVDEEIKKHFPLPSSAVDEFIKNHPDNSQARSEIEQRLSEEKRKQIRADYAKSLRAGHKIDVFLHRPQPPLVHIDLATAEIDGRPDAPIKLVVFSDFQCPYCGRLAPILKRARTAHPDDVMLAFRYFPMASHARARAAAAAAACAGTFGKFWEYHDFLFAHQDDFPDAELLSAAKTAGIDEHSFQQCLASGATRAKVDSSYNDAINIGLDTAPSLFLNGTLIGGVPTYDDLESMIHDALKAQK
jgi:protein-disulfide isomerase/uncharacterized membrane protein